MKLSEYERTAIHEYLDRFFEFKKICRKSDSHLTQHEIVLLYQGYAIERAE